MKTLKFSLFAALLALASFTVSAQKSSTPSLEKTGKSKISGEDSLGIKSGADPKKAAASSVGKSRKKGRPVVFVVGDSTVKNGQGDGRNGQWGWGNFFWEMVDTTKVSVENHALGGRSSRTFITEGLWNKVLSAVQPGDYVLIQFGHNDSGPLNTGRARASLPGNGNNDTTVVMEATGKEEKVQSFGWYMRKYAQDVKAKKATPILISHIPRNMFTSKDSTTVIRNTTGFGKWTKEAAAQEKVPYIDLNDLVATQYEKIGKDSIQKMFHGDHTHTSKAGAILNATTVAKAIKKLNNCDLKRAVK